MRHQENNTLFPIMGSRPLSDDLIASGCCPAPSKFSKQQLRKVGEGEWNSEAPSMRKRSSVTLTVTAGDQVPGLSRDLALC